MSRSRLHPSLGVLFCVLLTACGPEMQLEVPAATSTAAVTSSTSLLSETDTPALKSVTPTPEDTVAEVLRDSTARVSVATGNVESGGAFSQPALSADGRFIAFDSATSGLAEGDTNNPHDVFVHDRETGVTERVSIAPDGSQSNQASWGSALSADGRHVAFTAIYDPPDGNEHRQVYVRDLESRATTLISVAPDGTPGNDQSGGRLGISASGHLVVFESLANNLVSDDTNKANDIFVHDRLSGKTRRVSVSSDGTQADFDSFGPAISADGRFVVFTSLASNLVPGDTPDASDVFIHEMATGQTSRVSAPLEGLYGNSEPAISADGRWITFVRHYAGPGPDITEDTYNIFLVDRATGVESLISVNSAGEASNLSSSIPAISGDGRYIAFHSLDSNLVAGDMNSDYDIFVYDRESGETRPVSANDNGEQGNGQSFYVDISSDGRVIAFASAATNLVPDDTNDSYDIFVHYPSIDGMR